MADTINTTEATHETKKPNAFVNFFKNNLADKRYDSLGLIGAGVLCCVLSGAMGIVGIIFVASGVFEVCQTIFCRNYHREPNPIG